MRGCIENFGASGLWQREDFVYAWVVPVCGDHMGYSEKQLNVNQRESIEQPEGSQLKINLSKWNILPGS